MRTPQDPKREDAQAPGDHDDGGSDSRLADAIGPCYTEESIAAELGHSPEEIAALVQGDCLLAVTTSDGHVVFPAFQLDHGRMVRGLAPVLRMLRKGINDPWTWALWLNSTPPFSADDHDAPGSSRMAQLIDGEVETVVLAAYHSAKSWRS